MDKKRIVLPSGHTQESLEKRQAIIRGLTGTPYQEGASHTPEEMQGIIENHIGFLDMPMGIASPLVVSGDYAKGTFLVPACTVEGTLVASMTRGMLATARSGGVTTTHIKQEVSRSPAFIFENVREIVPFLKWVEENFVQIKAKAETTTHYGKLIRIDKYPLLNSVVLDFIYSTGNAAGQNMVSLATQVACDYIQGVYKAPYNLDVNMSSDKKSSSMNSIRGRGHSVIAETVISDSTLKRILGTTSKDYIYQQEFVPYASHISNTSGIQLHLANALTAIYLATGQDAACVAENAIGYTQTKPVEGGTKFTLSMPSLTVGTVGGGTRLKDQRLNLELLGCHEGEDSSKKLAEIVCASALCLEISLMSAISTKTWVSSHMKYGREKHS
jgi:hydroxymethylglutaryl-CoA reductase (NADPH)